VFKSEVHALDYSLLRALKLAYEGCAGDIREACGVLDTFFAVSDRIRIRETYLQCKEKIIEDLVNAIVRCAIVCTHGSCELQAHVFVVKR
jgi:hypothetical protein